MDQQPYKRKWEKGIPITYRIPRKLMRDHIMSGIITGFTMGEGSFFVSYSRADKYIQGIRIKPTFEISLHRDDIGILRKIRKAFQCGRVTKKKSRLLFV